MLVQASWLVHLERVDAVTLIICTPPKPSQRKPPSRHATQVVLFPLHKKHPFQHYASQVLSLAQEIQPDVARLAVCEDSFPVGLFESILREWNRSFHAQELDRRLPELRVFEPLRSPPFRSSSELHLQPNSPTSVDDWEFLPSLLDQEEIHAIGVATSSPSNVLILGPVGAGKTQVARHIHFRTPETAQGFFHTLNFTAIPDSLFESHLFGAVRGAYTDLKEDRKGALRLADKGTLFLDEIAAIEGLQFKQAKLLEVISAQYRPSTFSPVGAQQSESSLVRFIAATNVPLTQLTAFLRPDLLSRYPLQIHLKPLYAKQPNAFDFFARAVQHFSMCDFTFAPDLCPQWDLDALRRCYQNEDLPDNLRDMRSMVFRVWLNRTATRKDLAEKVSFGEMRKAALAIRQVPGQREGMPAAPLADFSTILAVLRAPDRYQSLLSTAGQMSQSELMDTVYRLKRLALDVAIAHAPNPTKAMKTYGWAKLSSFRELAANPERLHPDPNKRANL